MQLAWNRLAETSRRLNLNSNSLLTRRNEYRPSVITGIIVLRSIELRVSKNFGNKYLKIEFFFLHHTRKPRFLAFFYFFFNESSEFGILERKEEGKKEPGGCSSLFPLPTLTTIMKQGLCKSAIWKSTWPVTRKASLYPTDKCDDCLTPRKVPKARAISKNNRSIGFFFFFPVPRGTTRSRVRVPPTTSPDFISHLWREVKDEGLVVRTRIL